MRDPFANNPHPLTRLASADLQLRLDNDSMLREVLSTDGEGKMFGVLVVRNEEGKLGYLAGFSGMLNGQWMVAGFVPPLFDVDEQLKMLKAGEAEIVTLSENIDQCLASEERQQALADLHLLEHQMEVELTALKQLAGKNKAWRKMKRQALDNVPDKQRVLMELALLSQNDKGEMKRLRKAWSDRIAFTRGQFKSQFEDSINQLKQRRKLISRQLHRLVFDAYRLTNYHGEVRSLSDLFEGRVPPGGAGDCAAPKLIQYAHNQNMQPLALAEFWWGAPQSSGIRLHGSFYPPCRGKCQPILPFMLKGIDIEPTSIDLTGGSLSPEIVYEDDTIVVLDKPAGLLSVPGKEVEHSVLNWLRRRYPEATGGLLLHRLDMATSGLLLAAKNAVAYKNLQKQFVNRSIKKRYVAVLSASLAEESKTISLPLRVDIDDRPRQMICEHYGKPALTHMKVIARGQGFTRVYFYPVTGRTHQLRVHAAHHLGLGAPIVGDRLYGNPCERLLLHAERLSFHHPVLGERLEIKSRVPF